MGKRISKIISTFNLTQNMSINSLCNVQKNNSDEGFEMQLIRKSNDQCQFSNLPLEVIVHIFSCFQVKELVKVMNVCSAWYLLANDNLVKIFSKLKDNFYFCTTYCC